MSRDSDSPESPGPRLVSPDLPTLAVDAGADRDVGSVIDRALASTARRSVRVDQADWDDPHQRSCIVTRLRQQGYQVLAFRVLGEPPAYELTTVPLDQ